MRKRFFVIAGLFLFTACAGIGMAEREKTYGKTTPVITASFASERVTQGEKWLVYVNASDPDGDMDKIGCSIVQAGGGPYMDVWIKVPDDQRQNLSGYIYLNTEGPRGFISIKLMVYVADKAGHRSKPAVFHLSFNANERSRQAPPPAGLFAEKDLGRIAIALETEEDW